MKRFNVTEFKTNVTKEKSVQHKKTLKDLQCSKRMQCCNASRSLLEENREGGDGEKKTPNGKPV